MANSYNNVLQDLEEVVGEATPSEKHQNKTITKLSSKLREAEDRLLMLSEESKTDVSRLEDELQHATQQVSAGLQLIIGVQSKSTNCGSNSLKLVLHG